MHPTLVILSLALSKKLHMEQAKKMHQIDQPSNQMIEEAMIQGLAHQLKEHKDLATLLHPDMALGQASVM